MKHFFRNGIFPLFGWRAAILLVYLSGAFLSRTFSNPFETEVAADPDRVAADTNIEVLLYPLGVDYPDSDRCGAFTLLFEAAIRNTGTTGLGDLRMQVDFAVDSAFGDAFQGLVEAPVWSAGSQGAALPPVNLAYDGAADPELFDEGAGRLLPGETISLRFSIEVFPEAPGASAAPQVQALALGVALDEQGMPLPDPDAPSQLLTVQDWSDDDPVFAGVENDPDDPTSLGDCWRAASNLSARGTVNITLDAACQALVTPASILSNFEPDCAGESLPAGGYYRLYYNHEEVTAPIDAAALVGESLVFQVKSVVNPCAPIYGTVRFEDNSPPVLECPETRYFTCADIDSILNNPATVDPASSLFTGIPVVRDNCSEALSFTWTDTFYDFGCSGGQIGAGDGQLHSAAIVRTFTAVDTEGNRSAGCQQVIYFDRPAVQLPGETIELDICRETIPLDAAGNPHPARTGYPFFLNGFGDSIQLDAFRCQYSAAYNDQRFPGPCPGAYKVIRLWQVYDWCRNRVVTEAQQVIEVGDFQAPRLSCTANWREPEGETDTLTFSTGPFNCTAAFVIPEPIVEGECSTTELETAIYTYQRPTDPLGNPYGEAEFVELDVFFQDGVVSGVPPGTHYFVYTATDACGNVAVSEPCVFKVIDAIEPIAICAGELTVSLGGSGIARLLASDVDKGSRDNCGMVDLSVRRQLSESCLAAYVSAVYGLSLDALERDGADYFLDGAPVAYATDGYYQTPWAEEVFLSCCDAGQTVFLDLRVQDAAGNANRCAVSVAVEDKLPPLVQAPSDREVWCDDLAGLDLRDTLTLQARFGQATASDNCRAWTRELETVLALDDCGIGLITRRFQAVDASGNLSAVRQQHIQVSARHDYVLRFPADAEIRQCRPTAADSLRYETNACDFLAINVEEETFREEGGACRRIFRTYRIINWCAYDNESDPVVIGRREDEATPPGTAVYLLRRPDGVFIDNNEDPADGVLREVPPTGYWQYTQIIDFYDDEGPLVEALPPDPFCGYGEAGSCEAPVEMSFSVRENCSAASLQVRVFFDEGADNVREANLTGTPALQVEGETYRVVSTFPLGDHQLIVEARDGCGNLTIERIPFSVVDCKAPAPVCIGAITAALSPQDLDADGRPDTALAEIAVADLLADTLVTDCAGPVRFSINRAGETPDPKQQQLVLGCDDLGGLLFVEVYAWDAADNPYALQPGGATGGPNYDFCSVQVTLTDPDYHCLDRTRIAGQVISEDSIPIQGVTVRLSGNRSLTAMTDADGAFEFGSLAPGYDYSLHPELDAEHMNGVSTLDLVRISKHILGVTPLDSPYKMLAADVNRSGTITILDLIQLRRLILGVLSKLPQNTSWRFVQAAHQFSDPRHPFSETIPETVHHGELLTPFDSADFIGLKVGDVTGDAGVDNLDSPKPREESAALRLQMEDWTVQTGKSFLAPVLASDLQEIDGFQFTLEIDSAGVALAGWTPGLLTEEHLAFFPAQNSLTVSWDRYSAGAVATGDTLFSLRLLGAGPGKLSDRVRISSRITRAEAYDDRETLLPILLDIVPAVSGLEVKPTFPNPFVEQTTLEVILPREGELFVQVRDVEGRVHWQLRTWAPAGRRQFSIPGNRLPTGLLFYSVQAAGQTITGKMIRLH